MAFQTLFRAYFISDAQQPPRYLFAADPWGAILVADLTEFA